MLRLAITAEGHVRHVPLPSSVTLRIGSARDNDIVIAAPGVSRHHARLERTENGVTIFDTGSKNGVTLAGRRASDLRLAPGTVVKLGGASVALEEVSTGEVDVAIRLSTESSGSLVPPQSDTESVSLDDGPSAAIRWMQRVETLTQHERLIETPSLLEEVRRITGAEIAMLFARNGDDIDIAALAGPLPENVDREWEIVGDGELLLGAKGTSHRSTWRRDFFEYVRVKLAPALGARGASTPRPKPDIVLPPRMIAGSSASMRRLIADITLVARGGGDVLILGETGTGKELVAAAIHQSSSRANGPFIAVNCAEIPASQAEAELFGIARGAATGVDARPGLFVAAHGGTLFLDEVGEMPEALQPALLRVLQEREVRAIASTEAKAIDVRVISSTNRDLEALVARETFRADLFYRICHSLLRVPPLRERREDIPQLATAIVQRAASAASKRIDGISRKALERLVAYDWPGNVRQLEHVLHEAVLRCPYGAVLQSDHLPALASAHAPDPPPTPTAPDLHDRMKTAEQIAIAEALARANGNKSLAAKLLGITRQGLYAKLKRFGIG